MIKAVSIVWCVLGVGSVYAQPEGWFRFYHNNDASRWYLDAILLNPSDEILATVSNIGFRLEGIGISDVEYNPSFDSDFFGPAELTVTPTSIDFVGTNSLIPIDGVDSSNPLRIMSFSIDSFASFDLVGQNDGAYAGPPVAVYLFQDFNGNPGDTPWFYTVPTPSSTLVLCIAGVVSAGRRR